jgi:hypothetical protein
MSDVPDVEPLEIIAWIDAGCPDARPRCKPRRAGEVLALWGENGAVDARRPRGEAQDDRGRRAEKK